MKIKAVKKILSGVLLMTPILTNAWECVTNDGKLVSGLDAGNSQNTDYSGMQKSATIFLRMSGSGNGKCYDENNHSKKDFDMAYENFTLAKANKRGMESNYAAECILPLVPIFVTTDEKESYTYPNKKSEAEGGIEGVDFSNFMKNSTEDIMCCLELADGLANEKKHVVFYRHREDNPIRYFFVTPTVAWEYKFKEKSSRCRFQFSLCGAEKITDRVFSFEDRYRDKGNGKYARSIYKTKIKVGNLGSKTLSCLLSQDWNGRNGIGKGCGLQGIRFVDGYKNKNVSIVTKVQASSNIYKTYHVFLSRELTEVFEKMLFNGSSIYNTAISSKTDEFLKDCNTSRYGDYVSFYAKLSKTLKICNQESDCVLSSFMKCFKNTISESGLFSMLKKWEHDIKRHSMSNKESYHSGQKKEKINGEFMIEEMEKLEEAIEIPEKERMEFQEKVKTFNVEERSGSERIRLNFKGKKLNLRREKLQKAKISQEMVSLQLSSMSVPVVQLAVRQSSKTQHGSGTLPPIQPLPKSLPVTRQYEASFNPRRKIGIG